VTDSSSGDTYEGLHERLGNLQAASGPGVRDVAWFDGTPRLGFARDELGRLEIFLTGDELSCASRIVESHLSYNTWHTSGDSTLLANRILLPPETHYDAVCAFVGVHLVECGVLQDCQQGFNAAEPVIELALEQGRMQASAIIGLCGEMLVLRGLLDVAPSRFREILAAWSGFERSARDFEFGSLGLEVKTTRGTVSRHHVQGVHQVELGHGLDGSEELHLILASVGLEPTLPGDFAPNSWSLPTLVESVVTRIETRGMSHQQTQSLVNEFLEQVRGYGQLGDRGYDHRTMQHRVLFAQTWQLAFFRAYDLADPAISIPRSSDLVSFGMLVPDSVEFDVLFPNQIRGDLNPIVGLNPALSDVVSRAFGVQPTT